MSELCVSWIVGAVLLTDQGCNGVGGLASSKIRKTSPDRPGWKIFTRLIRSLCRYHLDFLCIAFFYTSSFSFVIIFPASSRAFIIFRVRLCTQQYSRIYNAYRLQGSLLIVSLLSLAGPDPLSSTDCESLPCYLFSCFPSSPL